eukprot:613252-Alexandrium_andersonii.AAC.1
MTLSTKQRRAFVDSDTTSGRVLLQTDDEPALVDLRRAVAARVGVQTVLGSPPAYEPQANGASENAVRQLKGLARTLMLALQERFQGEIPVDHPVMLWLCLLYTSPSPRD